MSRSADMCSTRFSSSRSASPGVLRAAVQAVDGNLPVWDVSAMETLLEKSVSPRRFTTGLFAGFAALALLLALIGIYGVLSHFVARRHREIGLRMTLGAEASDVVRLVVGEGIRPILLGLAAGLLGAVALSRVLARLLFQVSPTDPLTLFAAPLLLGAVGLLASYLPARRAASISPMEALRKD